MTRSTVVLLLALVALSPAVATADVFDCYEGCADSLEGSVCTEGPAGDWHTSCTGLANCPDAGSNVTVLSIHGGRVELHTSTISADMAAAYGWNRYDFDAHLDTAACEALATDGIPNNNNHEVLHVTATHYDHAEALTLVGAHPNAVSVHGCGASCSDETICVGGGNTTQVTDFIAYVDNYTHLLPYDLHPTTVPTTGTIFCNSNLTGTHVDNIVNRTSTSEGLQLEMSRDVRNLLASSDVDDEMLRALVYGGAGAAVGEEPLPLATLERVEPYSWNGRNFERFHLDVENQLEFTPELFDPAPNLPPCGLNTNSSRTWVNIRDGADDSYVYGFCAFSAPSHLSLIWFAREVGTAPATVYVELEDRETGRTYRSNLVAIP